MSEPTRDAHALTARYFDGELEGAEEQAALEHLAGCAQCQAELGDFMGLEVALSRPTAVVAEAAPAIAAGSTPGATATKEPTAAKPAAAKADGEVLSLERMRAARARRWLAPAAITATLAAAAGAVLLVRKSGPSEETTQLALAATRGVEARFTSAAFARHRPYDVVRGSGGREEFSLTQLARLERTGDRAALAAAQAASGELERARAALTALPASAQRDADLAAIELLAGQPELALEAADRSLERAPALAAAQWNRALALRELGLPLTAAAAFEQVSRGGEDGWSVEAATKAAALRAAMADRGPGADAFKAAALAMVDHKGPPLGEAEASARPGLTRLYFLDALRSAATRQEALALAPLAAALDRGAGNTLASAAVTRVAAADFATRGPLALAYRELATGRAPGTAPDLLARAGKLAGIEDLRLGLALYARLPVAELAPLIEATGDPWFTLHLQRERAAASRVAGTVDRAETELRTALAGCDRRVWAFRCAQLAHSLMSLYLDRTRYPEYEAHAELAAQLFRASGATELEDASLLGLAEAQRLRGRFARSAATFREVIARLAERDCASARYAKSGLALLEIYRSASLRAVTAAELPSPNECEQPPNEQELGSLVDLARMTGRDDDWARAYKWIDAAKQAVALAHGNGPAPDAAIVEAASARLAMGHQGGGDRGGDRDGGAVTRLRAQLPKLAGDTDVARGFRAWIYQTLIDDAARRGAWPEAMAIVAEELGGAAPARCALAVSLDDTRGTAIAIGADGAATGMRTSVETPPQWDGARLVPAQLRAAFAGCATIGVLARPPLQGRSDLLPPELPWAFEGRPAPTSTPPTPAKPGAAPLPAGAPPQPSRPSMPPRELYIGDALPPAALTLPALAPMPPHPGAEELRAAAATPTQVLAALGRASYAELHVHGQVDLGVADASFLALSPDADQRWALTAAEVRTAKLAAMPVIVLAACRAATTAPYEHKRWSLPDAFLEAGARAVIAPTVEIPDAEATAFFAELRGRLVAGEEPSAALAALRKAYVERGAAWAGNVVLFR